MSVVHELQQELFRGVVDGRREAIEEAPTLTKVAGLKNPNYDGMEQPIYLAPLPHPTLGVTGITKDGGTSYVAVNRNIPLWVEHAMRVYNKGAEWAKEQVYRIAKLTTEHELGHVQSSRVANGEEHSEKAVDVMESVTTYAKHKTAKRLGKHEKAGMIKATNPYPNAWRLGEIADWAPYEGPSGTGYAAFMRDAQSEPFYKPMGRLAAAAAKGTWRKAKESFAPQPKYAFAYAR